jgi:DNA-binding XRE family transcriptional regulator
MEQLEFRKQLIEYRKLNKLTQAELAEVCGINKRTIQRIETNAVTPRLSTIKIITQILGEEHFISTNTGLVQNKMNQKSNPQSLMWSFKDLFNLKTHTMKKISILSSVALLLIILFSNSFELKANESYPPTNKTLTILRNEDNSIKFVSVWFNHTLNLDSLIRLKKNLLNIGIKVEYKMMKFGELNNLTHLECKVSEKNRRGSFTTEDLRTSIKKFGFSIDYNKKKNSTMIVGLVD